MSDQPFSKTAFGELWRARIAPSRTAFFLDVDGTLLGFQPRPSDVVADDALLALLRRLAVAADGALALVSGRMIADLDRIVAPLVLPAAGVHGADIRFADGRRETMDASAMDQVRDLAERFVAAHPGLMLEDKGLTLALHYRAAPELEGDVIAFATDLSREAGVALQAGTLVAELKPVSCNKGEAIRALMRSAPFHGRIPLFAGDDLTDEYGFGAVNGLGGISIKVGTAGKPTSATFHVADPGETRELLAEVCRSEGSR